MRYWPNASGGSSAISDACSSASSRPQTMQPNSGDELVSRALPHLEQTPAVTSIKRDISSHRGDGAAEITQLIIYFRRIGHGVPDFVAQNLPITSAQSL